VVVGGPSVVSDDLVQSERWRFNIPELLWEFPHISCTVLDEISMVRRGYTKHRTRCVLKCSTQNAENGFGFFRVEKKPGFRL
jgi:hypothetical protein